MTKKIAINGFGRVGRLTFRALQNKPDVEVVAINDLTDSKTLAHLLKYDSAHGQFDGTISLVDDCMAINGKKITCYSQKDPAQIPWHKHDIDVVLECTGLFRTREKAQLHLDAGAKKVIISAPGKGGDIKTIVLGVNDKDISDDVKIYSNASCTTNCLAPLCKIVDQTWGFEQASMTTIHAYTADQQLQDAPHKDLRRARAAAYNIVPTTTGAADAAALVLPQIKGKMFAMAIRVPIIAGSLVELNVIVRKEVTREEVNATFKRAAESELKGILQYTEDPLVSSDIVSNTHSSIFDAQLTAVKGKMIKIVAWYDNEAGYSARLAQLACAI
jgi:glyceraldehyde 3-phosphate dehydrogenase